jgi:hypothetical protein
MFGWITNRKRIVRLAAGLSLAGGGMLGGVALAGSSSRADIPPADPIPAKMLGADVPVPISPELLSPTNAWVTSDGQTLTAVYAGADGNDSSTGRFVVIRQDLDAGAQTVDSVDTGKTGPISIVNAPLGPSVETSAQQAQLSFSSSKGWTGSIDLGNSDAVESRAP